MKLGELIAGIDGAKLDGNADVEISRIEYDSRRIDEGCLFVAIKGFQSDGYDFVKDAVNRGAVAVLGARSDCDGANNHVSVGNDRQALADVAAKFYGYPGMNIKACGVTGTNGKTTTCHLIRNILQARNKTTGLVTSAVYSTGRDYINAERTTPESLDLQALLFQMKRNHCVNAVIEVSSHALALHRVDNIDFRVAVYTNLTRDHLDFHKTFEEYAETKAKLARRLDGPLCYTVVNLDVPEFRQLIGDITSSHIGYSLDNEEADVYCSNYELKSDGTIFDLVTPMGTHTIKFPLPGRFNLMNALAGAAGGLASGIDLDNVVRGLEKSVPIPGRFNPVDCGQPFAVFVDYAHTPDAIERLCESARELTKGRVLILFGCGGNRDKGKRPLMGKAGTAGSDFAVVSSDNPRGEDPLAIIEDIKPGLEGDNFKIIPDRKEAIATIIKAARDGDAVLLAGKGAENYQEIMGKRHPFDDTAEARKVLAEMGYSNS